MKVFSVRQNKVIQTAFRADCVAWNAVRSDDSCLNLDHGHCARSGCLGLHLAGVSKALQCFIALLALSACLVAASYTPAFAFWHNTGWCAEGNYDTSWYNGSGNYVISTSAQLAGLSYILGNSSTYGESFAGATITLASDIDLSGNEWQPIGHDASGTEGAFRGTFNGNGHTINGLTISGTGYNQALFGNINGALIENLVVRGSVQGSSYSAGIVAWSTNSSLVNLASYVDVVATGGNSVDGYLYNGNAGGVVCYAATTTGGTQYFQNLYNYGTVTGAGKGTGGVIGFLYGSGNSAVSQCANYSDVTVLNCANAEGSASIAAGGVVGQTSDYGSYQISECLNSGTISTGNLQTAGGIVGHLGGTNSFVSYSYNTGSVQGAHGAAGVVGDMTATGGQIAQCYNSGSISGATVGAVNATSTFNPADFSLNNYYLEGSALSAFAGGDVAGGGESKSFSELASQDALGVLDGGTGIFSGMTSANSGLPWLTWQGFAIPGGGIGDNPGSGDGGTPDGGDEGNPSDGGGEGNPDGSQNGGNGFQEIIDSGDNAQAANGDAGAPAAETAPTSDNVTTAAAEGAKAVDSSGVSDSSESGSYHLVEIASTEEEPTVADNEPPWWSKYALAIIAALALLYGVYHEYIGFKFQNMKIPVQSSDGLAGRAV